MVLISLLSGPIIIGGGRFTLAYIHSHQSCIKHQVLEGAVGLLCLVSDLFSSVIKSQQMLATYVFVPA